MAKENISQEFRLKSIHQARNYFVEEIEQKQLMSKKHKKVCASLNYIGHFLILASTVTGYISISHFVSLADIPIGIMNFAIIGLNICAIAAGIKTYKSIIKKKREKNDKTVLLAKSKSHSIEVIIAKVIITLVMMNLF